MAKKTPNPGVARFKSDSGGGSGGGTNAFALAIDNPLTSLAGFTQTSGVWTTDGASVNVTQGATPAHLRWNIPFDATDSYILEWETKCTPVASTASYVGVTLSSITNFLGTTLTVRHQLYAATDNATRRIYSDVAGATEQIPQSGVNTWTPGNWVKVRFVKTAYGTLYLFKDGVACAWVARPTTAHLPNESGAGYLYLHANNATASFRNLKAWSTAAPWPA